MTARTLDAGTIADRMNARPLDEWTDGGEWYATIGEGGYPMTCDVCSRTLPAMESRVISGGGAAALLVACLPCAIADCERAEAGVWS